MIANLEAICEALDALRKEKGKDAPVAAGLLATVESTEFCVGLFALETLLGLVEDVTTKAQGSYMDVAAVMLDVDATIANVKLARNSDAVIRKIFERTEEALQAMDVVPAKPRTPGRQRNRGNAGDPNQSWQDHFKVCEIKYTNFDWYAQKRPN